MTNKYIKQMTVQNLKNPVGIGTHNPVLGYVFEKEYERQSQSAMRILVASSKSLLEKEQADLWDTGKRVQKETFGICYEGKEIKSGQRVYWKVKVWDETEKELAWSDVAYWEMGLLELSDWKGQWIGQGDDFQGNKAAAPMFVKDFRIQNYEEIERARLYISGLGLFQASINGKTLADTYYDPGESSAGKTVYYVTYDVTEHIQEGANAIGVILGNGQYTGFQINPVMTLPDGTEVPEHRYQKNDGIVFEKGIQGNKKFIAQLEIAYEDGSKEIKVISDTNWKWLESPTVFQNWYGGEDYDSLQERQNWDSPNGSRDGWKRAIVMQEPGGRLMAREFEPIRITESFYPQSVKQLSNGNWLVDMGKNGAGFVRLRLYNTTEQMRGTWIKMYPAEILKEDGSGVDQSSCTQSWNERYHCAIINSYRVKGMGEETWNPSFAYQGFQYVEVEGFPGIPEKENFECCIVRTANEKTGQFYCSDEILNRINAITERSMESNMFGAFTDCPQIEKLGWIETSHLMFRSLAGTYDIRSWMRKIIRDIADSQVDKIHAHIDGNEPEGYVPAIVPEYQRIKGLHLDPNWNGACIFTPWEYYSYYGEKDILEKTYPIMKRYLLYLNAYVKNGILEDYAQMGEWGEYGEKTPTVLVATASYYRMLCIVNKIASILERKQEAEEWLTLAEKVKKQFHKHPICYDEKTGVYGSGSQASYGCVLFSGLVPEDRKAETVEKLVDAVRKNDYHLTSGEVGLKQVFCALAENGRSDVVYQMIMNKTAPSYRIFVEQGLTTLPEYWNYEELWHGMTRSRNHAMMGHVKEWLIYYMLGIRPLKPAFEEVLISPYMPDDICELKGSIMTPYGKINVVCHRDTDYIAIDVFAPQGVVVRIEKTKQEYKYTLCSKSQY